MNEFSEDKLIEQTAVKLFGELWGADNFANAYSGEMDKEFGRENPGEVVLMNYLKIALVKLNPSVSTEALNLAIDELIKDRSAMSMVNANHEIWQLLRDGVKVETENKRGERQTETVKVIDFENPKENHFMLVSQLWITGELHKRRPDLIGFVNGIPLVLIELKASHKNLRNAYSQNIRDYKDTIPQLFWYNAFIIISNGIESKVGTLTGAYEHFNEWKKIKDEKEIGKVSMETVIKGTCEPARLLDIVENFILFDDSRGERVKAIARYFQFFGVNRAFEEVRNRDKNKGRLGVFWHTQGSGKSYSMVFLSQKVFRKLTGNFTFVVVTDRKELDRQIYKTFAACGAVYENEVHADSIRHLQQLLGEDHRHVFTLIQKFGEPKELSNRNDVIVMADEAHRTQYDRMAANMRISLPKASFIGFTGTPLMAGGEEKTREAFGDYVSTYNFAQSVEDGATVPLFYENRVPKLENVNPDIQKDLERVMNFYDLAPEEEEKLEQEFSTFYHLITREDRLNKVAEDIVTHFTARGYNGKAMVVSIDKKTAIRMHAKVKEQMQRHLAKLNIALSKATDEHEKEKIRQVIEQYEGIDMAVVVSQSQNEIADMEEFEIDMRPLRARIQNEDLETKFKDPDSNLRIVFVCAMWITGFDVLNLSTLYLDKPLKNHTLMQTIARANRVYPGKTNGLIVDYIGVFRNIQRALAIYATPESGASIDDIIKEKEELVELLVSTAKQTREFLKKLDLDIDDLLKAKDAEKIRLVDVFTNRILHDEQTKKGFLDLASDAYQLYKSVLPEPKAEDYYQEVTAYKVIASRIKEVIEEEADVSQVKKDLEDLLDRSIKAGEFVIKEPKLKDLSHIDFEALRKFFDDTENKNIAAESLSAELEEKIKDMARKNKIRKHFLDRLNSLIHEYNSGSRDLDVFFEELLVLAKELSEEDARAIKENLTEEELAIFDLLVKEKLNPDEVDRVKKVAHELLAKLKTEKFVLDWKRKEETRADVKITIRDMLYDNLPEPAYTDKDCEDRTQKVYFHIYDNYVDANVNVYVQ
ncbi:MAG: Type I site-specific deoxyribonuclease, HsdR family [Parcubacteria group bacterium GW2011_GWB1_44_7]|nr:MAG: Type I site-specific deoxyribonuclease, HsdR family [Parcubacteria group bacterium GW2011_GWB1_44_7]